LLNGKAVGESDYIEIRRGSVERWRILNSANARTAQIDITGAEWRIIATDGGLIPEPYTKDVLQIAPGERYDIEVRWAPENVGDTGVVRYWVPTLQGEELVWATIPILTLFSSGHPALPPHDVELPPVELPQWPIAQTPTITVELDGVIPMGQEVKWMLNGKVYGEDTPVEVALGSEHTIALVNKKMQEHPMHIHGHFFQVVSRGGKPANEPGLKDTVLVGGEETVVINMVFDNPGSWMYHCHILEHAKQGMMGVIEVQ
jgi:FtsP/CotA-like multicopper oxidase with cupredoxin domain